MSVKRLRFEVLKRAGESAPPLFLSPLKIRGGQAQCKKAKVRGGPYRLGITSRAPELAFRVADLFCKATGDATVDLSFVEQVSRLREVRS